MALHNVLKVYSLYDTDVGYCQGMGFLAALLLMYLEEEVCFRCLSCFSIICVSGRFLGFVLYIRKRKYALLVRPRTAVTAAEFFRV